LEPLCITIKSAIGLAK